MSRLPTNPFGLMSRPEDRPTRRMTPVRQMSRPEDRPTDTGTPDRRAQIQEMFAGGQARQRTPRGPATAQDLMERRRAFLGGQGAPDERAALRGQIGEFNAQQIEAGRLDDRVPGLNLTTGERAARDEATLAFREIRRSDPEVQERAQQRRALRESRMSPEVRDSFLRQRTTAQAREEAQRNRALERRGIRGQENIAQIAAGAQTGVAEIQAAAEDRRSEALEFQATQGRMGREAIAEAEQQAAEFQAGAAEEAARFQSSAQLVASVSESASRQLQGIAARMQALSDQHTQVSADIATLENADQLDEEQEGLLQQRRTQFQQLDQQIRQLDARGRTIERQVSEAQRAAGAGQDINIELPETPEAVEDSRSRGVEILEELQAQREAQGPQGDDPFPDRPVPSAPGAEPLTIREAQGSLVALRDALNQISGAEGAFSGDEFSIITDENDRPVLRIDQTWPGADTSFRVARDPERGILFQQMDTFPLGLDHSRVATKEQMASRLAGFTGMPEGDILEIMERTLADLEGRRGRSEP